jgi:hypothetical protein
MASPETRRKRTRSAALRDAIQQFEDDFEDAIDIFDGDDLDHDPV